MGWIADVLIAALAACSVGVMLYQNARHARGKTGCCQNCRGCDCGTCTESGKKDA